MHARQVCTSRGRHCLQYVEKQGPEVQGKEEMAACLTADGGGGKSSVRSVSSLSRKGRTTNNFQQSFVVLGEGNAVGAGYSLNEGGKAVAKQGSTFNRNN